MRRWPWEKRQPGRPRRAAGPVIVTVCWALLVGGLAVLHGQRAVLVVRHAERIDQSPDAALSAAGIARASRLVEILKDAGVAAIYATTYQRTIQTAEPLARVLGLEIERLPPEATDALDERLRTRHRADVVLVVGHSNTVPAIIKALGGQPVSIADAEFDNLFVLIPGTTGGVTLLRLKY